MASPDPSPPARTIFVVDDDKGLARLFKVDLFLLTALAPAEDAGRLFDDARPLGSSWRPFATQLALCQALGTREDRLQFISRWREARISFAPWCGRHDFLWAEDNPFVCLNKGH